jgi:hypothetical protein
MAEINQISSVINDRYIEDYGLYYDLRMIHPQQFTDTTQLNAKVDEIRALIGKTGFDYRPTIGLLERQWVDMSEDYKKILQPKVWILLYKAWNNSQPWPTLPVYGEVDIVCVPVAGKAQAEWPCYSKWDINAIAYRWPMVPPIEPVDEDPVTPPDDEPTIPPETPTGLKQGYIVCPHCGGKLIL